MHNSVSELQILNKDQNLALESLFNSQSLLHTEVSAYRTENRLGYDVLNWTELVPLLRESIPDVTLEAMRQILANIRVKAPNGGRFTEAYLEVRKCNLRCFLHQQVSDRR